jgi:hypothetical protein
MTSVLYLVYKKKYCLEQDDQFVAWLTQARNQFQIKSLTIVDNFLGNEKVDELFVWNDIDVRIVGGDNSKREFSGYLRGWEAMPISESYVILNDTFVQPKHKARELMLPAVSKSLEFAKNSSSPCALGEINRGPADAVFAGEKAPWWISSYCFVLNQPACKIMAVALSKIVEEFEHGADHLSYSFIEHIRKQVKGRPESANQAWMMAKLNATAAELLLTRKLVEQGVLMISMYSPQISVSIFTRNTIRRTIRKFRFLTGT